jgi:hypothetical protein
VMMLIVMVLIAVDIGAKCDASSRFLLGNCSMKKHFMAGSEALC